MALSETNPPGPSKNIMQNHQNHDRILLVEDSIVQAEILRRTLVKHGFAVDHALNGVEGLAKIKAARPDLVIGDVIMPGMSGFELCRAIRREEDLKDLPVILLTSLSNLEDVLEGLEAGAFNFITKPYDETRLLNIVREQLDKVKNPDLQGKEGLEITCGGQKYTIREKPEKILDFFLSTYSIAVDKNLDLARVQEELRILNEQLEHKVQERALALIAEASQRQQAEEELDRSRRYQELILNAVEEGILGVDLKGYITFANPAAAKLMACTPEELSGQPLESVCRFSLLNGKPFPEQPCPFLGILRDGKVRMMEGILWRPNNTSFFAEASSTAIIVAGKITGAVITLRDITERRQAEEDRLAHLQFFENMDQVNRAMQMANDLEQMMSNVLDAVLSIFDCDRAWLLHPCDAEAASWRVPTERTRPEYPGALNLGLEVPMDMDVISVFRTVLATNGPVTFGPGSEHPLPAGITQRFGNQSQIVMAIYPKGDKPYMFGLHQCSYPRVWTPKEVQLFQEIGRRLTDALTSLLMHRNLRDSEQKYRLLVNQIPAVVFKGYADWSIDLFDHKLETITGYPKEDFDSRKVKWSELILPEDLPGAKAKFLEA
ncbi:MAG: response regulator, partial [Pseudomonadota bacterium]